MICPSCGTEHEISPLGNVRICSNCSEDIGQQGSLDAGMVIAVVSLFLATISALATVKAVRGRH